MYGEDDIVDYVVEAVFENGRYLMRANVSRTAPIVDGCHGDCHEFAGKRGGY